MDTLPEEIWHIINKMYIFALHKQKMRNVIAELYCMNYQHIGHRICNCDNVFGVDLDCLEYVKCRFGDWYRGKCQCLHYNMGFIVDNRDKIMVDLWIDVKKLVDVIDYSKKNNWTYQLKYDR